MESRVALISIIIQDNNNAQQINSLLHEYNEYIIGRMGLPYREKEIYIISVALDAPMEVISSISGKIGNIPGVSTKAVYAKE